MKKVEIYAIYLLEASLVCCLFLLSFLPARLLPIYSINENHRFHIFERFLKSIHSVLISLYWRLLSLNIFCLIISAIFTT